MEMISEDGRWIALPPSASLPCPAPLGFQFRGHGIIFL